MSWLCHKYFSFMQETFQLVKKSFDLRGQLFQKKPHNSGP